jgi:hypothetical protein
MDRLLCCLLGFPEKDAQVLRSLTRLFRPSLSADWAFEVGVTEDCDLLVCDLDDAGGRHAWNSPAPPGLLRAAASANDVDAGALLLRKPLRGHGPSGVVQVLNAAAPSGDRTWRRPRPRRRPATAQPPPRRRPKRPARRPPSSSRNLLPAPRPICPNRVRPPWLRRRWSGRRPRPARKMLPPARRSGPASRSPCPTGPPRKTATAAPAPRPPPCLPARRRAASPEREPQPAWASSEAPQLAEPAQDDADIKDILRRMRFATLGTTSEARSMLEALRGIRGSDQATVLEATGLKSICVLPQAPEIFGWLAEGNRPVRLLPFASTDEARDAAGCKEEPVRPLEQLMWMVCLRTPPERLLPYETALFRLKRWPDLGNLPHEPHHMHWCGILTRQRAGLNALAANGGERRRVGGADGGLPRRLRRARHPGAHGRHRLRDRGGAAAGDLQEGPRAHLAVQEHPWPVAPVQVLR